MSFGGSVQAMIVSLRNNKRNRKTIFEKDIIENNNAYGKFVDTKKMTPAQFKRFQENLKEANRKRERKLFVIFGASMAVILSAIIYFLFYFTF